MRPIILCGFLILAPLTVAIGQDSLPPGTRVRITAPTHFDGRKRGVVQPGAVIEVPVGEQWPLTVPLVDVTRLDRFAGRESAWWAGARRGGFLGFVGGGVAGLVLCALDEPNDWDCETAALGAASWGTVGLVLGGAVGAGVGVFFKHDTWQEVPLDWLTVGVRPPLASDAEAQRRGFIIGVGIGPGLSTGDVDTKVGVATDFRIGTMIGRSVQLYFANKMTFTDIRETQDVDSVGAVGVTGIGVTYQMPSGVLINGLVGVLQLHWPEKAGRIGIGAGVGYEFAEHWVVALDGSFGRVDDWSAPAQSSDGKVTFLNVALTLNVLSF